MLIAAVAMMIGMGGAVGAPAGMYLVSLDAKGLDALFLNVGTVEERPGHSVRFWNLQVYSNARIERNVKYRQVWTEIRCAAGTVETLKAVEYNAAGESIFTLEDGGGPQVIVPDSRAADLRELVCTPGALRRLDTKGLSRNTADAIGTFDDFVVAFARSKSQGGGTKAPAEVSTGASAGTSEADEQSVQGFQDMDAGKDDSALSHFNRAVALGTRDPNTYVGRAIVRGRAGEMENARADYDHALALDPENGPAYAGRARLLSQMGKPEGAIRDASRALELIPGLAYIYDIRGWAYEATEQWDLAFADFDAASKIDAQDAEAWAGRGAAGSGRKDYEQALKDFNRALAIQPDADWIYVRRGATFTLIGNYDEAIADFTRALELNPDNGQAAELRALLYEAKAAAPPKTIS